MPERSLAQACEVAREVLKHIDDFRFSRGVFLGDLPLSVRQATTDDHSPDQRFSDAGYAYIQHCPACLLGSCFLAYAVLTDKYKVRDLFNDLGDIAIDVYKVPDLMAEVFQPDDCHLMEAAFELCPYEKLYRFPDDEELVFGAAVFGARCGRSLKERVKRVLQNVLDHNGRFQPGTASVEMWKTAVSQMV